MVIIEFGIVHIDLVFDVNLHNMAICNRNIIPRAHRHVCVAAHVAGIIVHTFKINITHQGNGFRVGG